MPNNVDITIRGRNQAGAAIAAAQAQLAGLRGVVNQLVAGFGLGLGAGVFQQLASGIAGAIRSGVAYNTVLESNTAAFKTLLGSAGEAARRMQELSRFAATTPFELPEVVAASRVLQSLTDGAMASGSSLRLIGDAAAASGRSFQETSMWVGRLYAGLKSGTPVGEATMRLLEMGLISGDTKRQLDQLAESGEATGNAMQVITSAFAKTRGAMGQASTTFQGLASTFRDMVKSDLATATSGITDALKALMQAILEARGLINSAQQVRQDSRNAKLAGFAADIGSARNPGELFDVRRRIEEERNQVAASVAQWGRAIGGMSPAARATLVTPPEIESQMEQLRQLDLMLDRVRNPSLVASKERQRLEGLYTPPGDEDLFYAKLDIQRQNEAILAQQSRMVELADEDAYWVERAKEAYSEQNRLLVEQSREKERAVEKAAEEQRRGQQRAFEGSYVGGTAARFGQFQESSAVDDQAGIGGGMLAGVQNSMMQLGSTAQQVGGFIQGAIGGALEGISSSVEGLIRGTMTWAQAFRNVGTAILSAVVSAFAQMIAQMVVSFVLQAVFGQAAKKQAASIGAAWHAAAVSASIATEGTAAGVGLAAFLTAQSTGVAAATGMQSGFAAGGYTGDGPVDQVAGWVHRREYVVPAYAVERLGVRNLEAMTSGAGTGSGAAQVAGGGAESRAIRIYNLLDRSELWAAVRDDLDAHVATILGRQAFS